MTPLVVRTSQSGIIPDTPGPLPEISGLIPDTEITDPTFKVRERRQSILSGWLVSVVFLGLADRVTSPHNQVRYPGQESDHEARGRGRWWLVFPGAWRSGWCGDSSLESSLGVIISDPVPGPDQRVDTPPLVIIKRVLIVLKQNIICRCKKSNKCSRKVEDLKHF